jgi:hypothetical protein
MEVPGTHYDSRFRFCRPTRWQPFLGHFASTFFSFNSPRSYCSLADYLEDTTLLALAIPVEMNGAHHEFSQTHFSRVQAMSSPNVRGA